MFEKASIDERTLPIDLQERIKDFIKCIEEDNSKNLDIYWGELYGSINSSARQRDNKRSGRLSKR